MSMPRCGGKLRLDLDGQVEGHQKSSIYCTLISVVPIPVTSVLKLLLLRKSRRYLMLLVTIAVEFGAFALGCSAQLIAMQQAVYFGAGI